MFLNCIKILRKIDHKRSHLSTLFNQLLRSLARCGMHITSPPPLLLCLLLLHYSQIHRYFSSPYTPFPIFLEYKSVNSWIFLKFFILLNFWIVQLHLKIAWYYLRTHDWCGGKNSSFGVVLRLFFTGVRRRMGNSHSFRGELHQEKSHPPKKIKN